jgi:Site-specific recombinase XerD
MFGCGLRTAEVCDLQVQQVSLKSRSAIIIGKGNQERTIHLPEPVQNVLDNWLELRQLNHAVIDTGFVFGRLDDRQCLHLNSPLDPSSVTRIIEKLVAETENLEGRFTPHDLQKDVCYSID